MTTDMGRPQLDDVLSVSRQALRDEVLPVVDDRPGYVVRMVCRMLEIAERELTTLSSRADDDMPYRTAGVSGEAELATGLSDRALDPADPAVWAAIVHGVERRLTVNRPGYSELTGAAGETGAPPTGHGEPASERA